MADDDSSHAAPATEIEVSSRRARNELLIVGERCPAILAFDSIARCLGIRTELIRTEELSELFSNGDVCQGGIVIGVGSSAGLRGNVASELVKALDAASTPILFLATDAEVDTQTMLRQMTGGVVTGLLEGNAQRVRLFDTVPVSLETYTYERDSGRAVTLAVQPDKATALMTLDDRPSFVRLGSTKHDRFVWATPDVIHADFNIVVEAQFEGALDRYAPVIIFLRHVFGEYCWHTPLLGAGIIIDDPTISRRYGCVDFRRLLASARRLHYRVTVAFIPWNHWRVRSTAAREFIEGKDCLSVCIHGCDHTEHEFESDDFRDLLQRAQLAMLRMMKLERRTSLQAEAVMVFPQEKFSVSAVRALAETRSFLGIVNTRAVPTAGPAGVTVADLLSPAQDALYGTPIFKRHYFEGMPEFAMSLFLGRPAIMAAHHDDFREGPAKVERFVEEISGVCRNLIWPSLGDLIGRIHWRRRLTNNVVEIRFFTNRFVYDIQDEGVTRVRLLRNMSRGAGIEEVRIDGIRTPFVEKDGWIFIETVHTGPGTRNIETSFSAIRSARTERRPLRYHLSVTFRRAASEFRDNVIARSSIGLSFIRAIGRLRALSK